MYQAAEPAKVLAPHVARTAEACKGLRVVAVQDTSEINFDRVRRPAEGLGPAGNPGIYGFFVHPVVVLDAKDEALLGVAGAQIWTRDEKPTPNHNAIPFDQKESRRWQAGAEMAAEHLAPVAGCRRAGPRGRHLSCVHASAGGGGAGGARGPGSLLAGGGRLFSAPAKWPKLGTSQVKVQPRHPGDKGRTATVTIKAGTVTLQRPMSAPNRGEPPTLTLGLVEVREAAAPKGAGKPLLWHLLTTQPVATLAEAEDVVRIYRLRWRIDGVLRIMKRDGLDIESSQLETAGRLFNLCSSRRHARSSWSTRATAPT